MHVDLKNVLSHYSVNGTCFTPASVQNYAKQPSGSILCSFARHLRTAHHVDHKPSSFVKKTEKLVY